MARKDEATKRAIKKYRRESTKTKSIVFFPADMDMLEHAESQGNFSGYIRKLIRADMENSQVDLCKPTRQNDI